MKPYYEEPGVVIQQGDAREMLAAMPAGSVHLCITSPPYWGLRAYAAPDVLWGGDPSCEHDWAAPLPHGRRGKRGISGTGGNLHPSLDAAGEGPGAGGGGAFCARCGAWRGQLGAEPTIELYVAHLVEVFREVRRVLRKDGTLFLNLGDSYASTPAGNKSWSHGAIFDGRDMTGHHTSRQFSTVTDGLKPKDLCMIPARVALALQADGWWLRSRIPWLKQNCMPESTTDRPGSAIEDWFMLTKSARCYWDPEAVRLPAIGKKNDSRGSNVTRKCSAPGSGIRMNTGFSASIAGSVSSRNRRNSDWLLESFQGLILDDTGGPLVMLVNPQGYDAEFCRAPDCQRYYDGPDKKLVRIEKYTDEHGEKKERRWCLCGRSDAWLSHYATFPELGVEAIIRAATSERGCCAKCGAPWRRVVKKTPPGVDPSTGRNSRMFQDRDPRHSSERKNREYRGVWSEQDPQSSGRRLLLNTKAARASGRSHDAPFSGSRTLGWRPNCTCDAGEPVPCVVMDCFAGTSTVGVVAERLGRRAILIEVSPDYIAMSKLRLAAARREPIEQCDPELPLFTGWTGERRLIEGEVEQER